MTNVSTGEKTWTWGTQIPAQYGRVAAFSKNKGERTELELVDCRSALTEKELSDSEKKF